jgi:hypothetical protein
LALRSRKEKELPFPEPGRVANGAENRRLPPSISPRNDNPSLGNIAPDKQIA